MVTVTATRGIALADIPMRGRDPDRDQRLQSGDDGSGGGCLLTCATGNSNAKVKNCPELAGATADGSHPPHRVWTRRAHRLLTTLIDNPTKLSTIADQLCAAATQDVRVSCG